MSDPVPYVVVLAAGGSRRFGPDDKLLTPISGRPLLAWTLDAVLDVTPPAQVLVVLAPQEPVRQELCAAEQVRTVEAADHHRGMRWSMHAGLQAVPPDAPGAAILLGDDPLAARALPAVLEAASTRPDRIVAVRRDPFLPHPVYLPRATWPAPPAGDEDHGLRDLLAGDVTWLDDDGPHPVDVDVPADAARLAELLASGGAR